MTNNKIVDTADIDDGEFEEDFDSQTKEILIAKLVSDYHAIKRYLGKNGAGDLNDLRIAEYSDKKMVISFFSNLNGASLLWYENEKGENVSPTGQVKKLKLERDS